MTGFTDLELAALRTIFLETPELAPALERQLEASVVTERENSGGGFFTTIEVADVGLSIERRRGNRQWISVRSLGLSIDPRCGRC